MGMLAGGVLIGMLLTVSVLQFGLNGGLIGAGLLFPQYLLYLPCMFIGLEQIYSCSKRLWKNRSFSAGQITGYLLRMLLCAALWLAGIFLEVYCNPKITEILIKNLKIF
jgi:stage II sporulation protein M